MACFESVICLNIVKVGLIYLMPRVYEKGGHNSSKFLKSIFKLVQYLLIIFYQMRISNRPCIFENNSAVNIQGTGNVARDLR